MIFNRALIVVIFTCFSSLCFSQEKEIEDQVKKAPEDTTKVHLLINLGYQYTNHNFKASINCATQALELSERLNFLSGKVDAYNCMADAYWYHSDYEKAQFYYFRSYRINDSLHNKRGIAYALYNIGWIICVQQHNYKEDHYLYKARELFIQLRDTVGILRSYNALGSYFSERYTTTKQKPFFDSALNYFSLGIEISKTPGRRARAVNFYANLADLYATSGDYGSALFYNEKASGIRQDVVDTTVVMMNHNNKANYLVCLKRYKEAMPIYTEVLAYCEAHDIKDLKTTSLLGMANCNAGLGHYEEAYRYFKLYNALNDTLNTQTFSTNLQEMQSSYELDKAQANLKEQKQLNDIQELKNKQNGYFIFILIGVAITVMVVAGLLFRQNKQKQLANTMLREQNNIIAEKKQEIENSIQYAKGIQNALLPDLSDLLQAFPESFVFYQPKDVVSGDFYWFQQVGRYLYCIAADCTGHGVPGALMSIIGMDKIAQAIFEKKIAAPGEILSFLNQEIKNVLKQHNDQAKQKDGMDIALLKFDMAGRTVEYAAANRPLYIVRQDQLIEYKADKVAIAGFTPPDQVYQSTAIRLEQNDSVYIFSDGYADQFGGDSGKKFMTKNLKQLFVEVAKESAASQLDQIRTTFTRWKDRYEQVDDVLVIGIRIV